MKHIPTSLIFFLVLNYMVNGGSIYSHAIWSIIQILYQLFFFTLWYHGWWVLKLYENKMIKWKCIWSFQTFQKQCFKNWNQFWFLITYSNFIVYAIQRLKWGFLMNISSIFKDFYNRKLAFYPSKNNKSQSFVFKLFDCYNLILCSHFLSLTLIWWVEKVKGHFFASDRRTFTSRNLQNLTTHQNDF